MPYYFDALTDVPAARFNLILRFFYDAPEATLCGRPVDEFVPSPNPHTLLGKPVFTRWCPVADGLMSDLHAFILPRRTPWPSVKSFAVVMASSIYDWDTLVLDGGASDSIPGGDLSLGRDGMPGRLRVVGPGTISASDTFSLSCRAADGCTGMDFDSVHVTGNGHVDGLSLYVSGTPLQLLSSTLSGASVTVRATALEVASSTFVDCTFVLETGASISALLSTFAGTFLGSASSAPPALYLYSGVSASIKSCKFENISSNSSGAALLVVGSTLDVVDSHFVGCSSGGSGGAIHAELLVTKP